MLILAGCGGAAQPKSMTVHGSGFTFEAPAGWQARSVGRTTTVRGGSNALLQVSSFRLLRPYRPELFAAVIPELRARMRGLAQQVSGRVTGSRVVVVAGARAHSYSVEHAEQTDDYTFVLRGKREYELLCRRDSGSDDSACKGLLTSFAPA